MEVWYQGSCHVFLLIDLHNKHLINEKIHSFPLPWKFLIGINPLSKHTRFFEEQTDFKGLSRAIPQSNRIKILRKCVRNFQGVICPLIFQANKLSLVTPKPLKIENRCQNVKFSTGIYFQLMPVEEPGSLEGHRVG